MWKQLLVIVAVPLLGSEISQEGFYFKERGGDAFKDVRAYGTRTEWSDGSTKLGVEHSRYRIPTLDQRFVTGFYGQYSGCFSSKTDWLIYLRYRHFFKNFTSSINEQVQLEHYFGNSIAARVGFRQNDILDNAFNFTDHVIVSRAYGALQTEGRVQAKFYGELQRYSGRNYGRHYRGEVAITVLEAPKLLIIEGSGAYYDVNQKGEPYWTPDHHLDYFGTLHFQRFFRDYKSYLMLRFQMGQDSDNYRILLAKIELSHKTGERWCFLASGKVHRSQPYNASAIFLGLTYSLH